MTATIPEVVIQRLPQYVRALTQLLDDGIEVISSRELGNRLQVTPAQIRKDLSYFGRFGKQGRGYNARYLAGELRQILGLDQEWNVAVLGVGRLGRAIVSYPGFAPEGFKVVAALDADPNLLGKEMDGLHVQSIDELEDVVRTKNIQIAIVAVPASKANAVIDRLVKCSLKAILNYAPVYAHVPEDVRVRSIDPVLALQSMTYHLKTLANKERRR